MPDLIIKAPGAAIPLPLGFASTIATIDALTAAPAGLVPGAARLVVAGIASGPILTLTLTSGTDGERYTLVARVTLVGNTPAERAVDVVCIEPSWVMPGGAPGWLPLDAFIARVGFDELVQLTRAAHDGAYDRARLIAALTDAQAEVEANLSARYALPLATVPTVVAAAVATLAHAALHGLGVPDGLADTVKATRRTLERIATGSLPLPLPAGGTAAPGATGDGVAWSAAERAYPDNLAGY